MKKLFATAVAVLFFSAAATAQQAESQTKASASAQASASAKAGNNSASLDAGTTFEAQLTKKVEAKKAKPGDRVDAKATKDVKSSSGGQVVVPKGSKIFGRVTEAKARSEGQAESSLGILFEKAVTKDGREIPLHVVIQAVAASHSTLAAQRAAHEDMLASSTLAGSAAGSGQASSSGGGLVGGATSTVGSTVGATTSAVGSVGQTAGATVGATTQPAAGVTGAVGGLDTMGNFTSSSSGVLGLRGLSLQSASAGSVSGSVISSSTENVRLDSGTRFMLRAVGESQPQQ